MPSFVGANRQQSNVMMFYVNQAWYATHQALQRQRDDLTLSCPIGMESYY
jgi:hypothetical protein